MRMQEMMRHFLARSAFACSVPLVFDAQASPNQYSDEIGRGLECLFVDGASIFQHGLKVEGQFGMANVGHQIYPGPNVVVAIRAWEDVFGRIDSLQFQKATIEFVPSVLEEGKAQSFRVLRSFYSEGSAGFVSDGAYSWASNPFKVVRIVRTGWRLDLTLEAAVEATVGGQAVKKPPVKVSWSCPVKARLLWQLDEWEGKVGTDWESFSPNHGTVRFILNVPPTPPAASGSRSGSIPPPAGKPASKR